MVLSRESYQSSRDASKQSSKLAADLDGESQQCGRIDNDPEQHRPLLQQPGPVPHDACFDLHEKRVIVLCGVLH